MTEASVVTASTTHIDICLAITVWDLFPSELQVLRCRPELLLVRNTVADATQMEKSHGNMLNVCAQHNLYAETLIPEW